MSAAVLRPGGFAAVLVAESRGELRKALRVPAFILPTLLFPAMFYALFALLIGGRVPGANLAMPSYLLATYGTFGVVGAALFGMGVGVAVERGQGWLTLKRATPMPPLAYFAAKAIMSMAIGAGVVGVLAVLGGTLGDVRLTSAAWIKLGAALTFGAVPFCALGLALGYLAGPNSAAPLANLVYLPMSLASGLWLPIEVMPDLMQRVAPLLPPYHLARLALGTIGVPANVPLHVAALAGFTVLFLGIAVIAYRRDDGRTWG